MFEHISKSGNMLAKYHCPIYCEDKKGMSLNGTSVLLDIKGTKWIVTAGHVADKPDLYLPSAKDLVELRGKWYTSMHENGRRKEDKDDWAMMKLDPTYVTGLNSYQFFSGEEILFKEPNSKSFMYSYVGFPETRNRIKNKTFTPAPYSNLNELIDPGGYTALGFSSERHLGLMYDEKNTQTVEGVRGKFPDPFGMSGGGAWIWDINGKVLNGGLTVKPRLAGIITEKVGRDKIWMATKIQHILNCIESGQHRLINSQESN